MGSHVTCIAISRQQGSGGSYIGRAVAERLGCLYFDREMLRTVAEYLHEQEHSSAKDTPPGRSWFERLGALLCQGSLEAGYIPPSPAMYDGHLVGIENRLIHEIADDHVAVIVGRGAAQMLRGRQGVVTVFVHAPETWRVDRVQRVYNTSDQAQAWRMVQQSDQERARFIRSVAKADWADPAGYDLTIDTMTLGLEPAVDLLVQSVEAASA